MARLLVVAAAAALLMVASCATGADADCVATLSAMTAAQRVELQARCTRAFPNRFTTCVFPTRPLSAFLTDESGTPACCPICAAPEPTCSVSACLTAISTISSAGQLLPRTCADGTVPTALPAPQQCCPSCQPGSSSGTTNSSTSTCPTLAALTDAQRIACKVNGFVYCAASVAPIQDATTCCPSCVPSGSSTTTTCGTTLTEAQLRVCASKLSTTPECPAGVAPRPDSDCCPSCTRYSGGGSTAPCSSTTTVDRQQCLTDDTIPTCATGTLPTVNTLTCCPSCRVTSTTGSSDSTTPTCTATTLPDVCATGVRPTINATTGCPSCTPAATNVDGCSYATIAACAWDALPLCAEGVSPTRDARTCCYLCRPKTSVASADNVCSAAAVRECGARLVAGSANPLPTCATGESPAWNATVCCRTCQIVLPSTATPTAGACSVAAFQACMAAVPACADNERPSFDATVSCCPSCRRIERTCDVASVAKCVAASPVCGADELPRSLDGCCASCRRVRPTCTPACSTAQICINVASTAATGVTTYAPACKAREDLAFTLAPSGTLAALFATMNAAQVRQAVAEYVRRYCDKPANAATCARYADELRELLIAVTIDCGTVKAQGGDTRVDGTIGADDATVPAAVAVAANVTASAGCAIKVFVSVAADTESANGASASAFAVMASSSSGSSAVVTSAVTTDSEATAQGLTATKTSTSTGTASGATARSSVGFAALVTAAVVAFA